MPLPAPIRSRPLRMKSKTLAVLILIAVFVALVVYALMGEIGRDAKVLAESISGTVEVKPELFAQGVADIVKTDRLAVILLDPATKRIVALKFETPLVPPQNIRIGQDSAEAGVTLSGSYVLIGITDKDGEVFKVSPGEVYGRLGQPVKLGDKEVRLVLDEPFRGSLDNTPTSQIADASRRAPAMPGAGASEAGPMRAGPLEGNDEDPARSIRGTLSVKKELAKNIAQEDHIVILLFDPEAGRPAAVKVIPHTFLPMKFSIGLPPGATPNKAGYQLRVITDKDGSPFNAAPGELVGRSATLLKLGTKDLNFVLDQPYVR